jgi:hypothetical protein
VYPVFLSFVGVIRFVTKTLAGMVMIGKILARDKSIARFVVFSFTLLADVVGTAHELIEVIGVFT